MRVTRVTRVMVSVFARLNSSRSFITGTAELITRITRITRKNHEIDTPGTPANQIQPSRSRMGFRELSFLRCIIRGRRKGFFQSSSDNRCYAKLGKPRYHLPLAGGNRPFLGLHFPLMETDSLGYKGV